MVAASDGTPSARDSVGESVAELPVDALPLRVETPYGRIDVLGTIFHVAVAEQLSVFVSRGAVQIFPSATC